MINGMSKLDRSFLKESITEMFPNEYISNDVLEAVSNKKLAQLYAKGWKASQEKNESVKKYKLKQAFMTYHKYLVSTDYGRTKRKNR